ncbi:glycosyltransferase family 2 protein [bacterium]|nr:glycosyltransferase family 2 protein [bacterium]
MVEPTKKIISVVVPCYCEAGNVEQFHKVLSKTIRTETNYDWKILLVDDGSHDDTLKIMQKVVDSDDRTEAVVLARNFGKEAALMAGVQEALPCDAVICMDADLQHPPSLIPQLIEEWESGWLVVATVRKSVGSHSIIRKLGSTLYYKLMKGISENLLIPKSTDFRLLDRLVIENLLQLTENVQMFRGMVDWFGFPTSIVYFEAPERFHGTANYSYGKLFQLAITSITSFSLWPLRLTGYAGTLIVSFSLLSLLVALGFNLATGSWYVSPVALVVLFNTLLVGVLMVCLGFIALYIGNIRDATLNRPSFVIQKRLQQSKDVD